MTTAVSKKQRYLVLYSTTDGYTATIADTIARHVQQDPNIICDTRNIIHAADVNLADYSKVAIGGSIRYGYFQRALGDYVIRNQETLNSMPSAFFGVNLTARKEGKDTAMTNAYTRKFLMNSPWKPQLSAVFAGALFYPRYRFYDRWLIQFIMLITGGETDATKEITYTDWNAVASFSSDFASMPLTVPPRPIEEKKQEKVMTVPQIGLFLAAGVGTTAALWATRNFLKTIKRR